jgi:glyoxylase I family protein
MSHFLGIDHIDIAVANPHQVADFLISLGFTEVRRTDHGGGAVELRFPGGTEQPILELTPAVSENGDKLPLGLRHIALRCANIDEAFAALSKNGFIFDKPPRTIAHTGRRVTSVIDPEGRPLQFVS